ncbi:hypothetical protein [Streptomyces sp. NPDC093094]|uniref:hypothetical protein n=1 Tax=Streptomyces sp. NPDC093094 TaxID=3366026 RepID=UPI00382A191B
MCGRRPFRDRRRPAGPAGHPRARGPDPDRCRRPGLHRSGGRLRPDGGFGRILAAYGGIFGAGPIARGGIADGRRPGRHDAVGALVRPARRP